MAESADNNASAAQNPPGIRTLPGRRQPPTARRRSNGRAAPACCAVDIPAWQSVLLGVLCVCVCGAIWWWLTAGDIAENRLVSPSILPSPAETFGDFKSLWFDRALTRNT